MTHQVNSDFRPSLTRFTAVVVVSTTPRRLSVNREDANIQACFQMSASEAQMWRHACNRKRTLARRRGVFVRGAGFTRAVCPEALLENDFEVKWLLERFRSYRTPRKLLELEVASDPGARSTWSA